MENYLDLLNDYFKKKNDLICFNSYSNDVRLFGNHIIKLFKSDRRLEKSMVGLQIMSNTGIHVPTVQYVSIEHRIMIQNFIPGLSLNEYVMKLTRKRLHDIGKIMGEFHNINTGSQNDEKTWIITLLSDIQGIKQKLAPFYNDFGNSIAFVEEECKNIFGDLHFTYVHGDFRPANILYNQSEKNYYLIDFENFMIGDPMLDIYKMLSVLKNISEYYYEDVKAFLDGYSSIRNLPEKLIEKWSFYDVYYSLRSVRRAINDDTFRNKDDKYIINADISAQRKNVRSLTMSNWLEKYFGNLH